MGGGGEIQCFPYQPRKIFRSTKGLSQKKKVEISKKREKKGSGFAAHHEGYENLEEKGHGKWEGTQLRSPPGRKTTTPGANPNSRCSYKLEERREGGRMKKGNWPKKGRRGGLGDLYFVRIVRNLLTNRA